MGMRGKLVAANWKMHGNSMMIATMIRKIIAGLPSGVDVVLCPPFPYLAEVAERVIASKIAVGAQDLSEHQGQGAFTGEVSAVMLADVGARWVVVGHSERRQYHGESDQQVARKFAVACSAGLTPILCVGETLAQREANQTEVIIATQLNTVREQQDNKSLAGAVIAYEPVWAIGSGRTASPQQVQRVHAFIRSQLAQEDVKIASSTRLLYGGSVKSTNAAELFAQPDVDGGLIGGASLETADFLGICSAACPGRAR